MVSLAAGFVFLRFLPTLPTVMQDEYIYLSQSLLKPVSENQFGNFLHSIVYSQVLVFGDDFYLGVKLINTLFLVLFGTFVVLTARKFIDNKLAILMGVGAVLSATGLYASIFTPEMMFFALASASIYFLTLGLEKPKQLYVFFGISLVFLTLAGLTKPHAIILGLGFVLFFAILMLLRRVDKTQGAYSIGIFIVGYPVLKSSLGFSIAGPSGLTLLGENYESAVEGFFIRFTEFSQGALSAAGATVSATSGGGFASFASFVVLQLFILAAALLFMTFGLPLLLVRPISRLSKFQLLIITVSVVYLFAIAGFSGLVTFAGDDHSDRILARYFEFLVPFIFIAVLIEVSKRAKLSAKRMALTVSAIIGLAVVWLVVVGQKVFRLADSGILLGSFREDLIPWLVIAIGLIFIVLLNDRPKLLMTWSTVLIVGTASIIGFSSQQRQIDVNSVKAPADYAGEDLRDNFSDIGGEDILIVGTNRQFAFVTKFWSLKANITHELTEPGTQISIENDVFDKYSVVVELPNVAITDGVVLREGNASFVATTTNGSHSSIIGNKSLL
jgi:hypothetical protein